MFVRCDARANLVWLERFSMQRRVAFVTETKAALNIVDEFLCSYICTFLKDIRTFEESMRL